MAGYHKRVRNVRKIILKRVKTKLGKRLSRTSVMLTVPSKYKTSKHAQTAKCSSTSFGPMLATSDVTTTSGHEFTTDVPKPKSNSLPKMAVAAAVNTNSNLSTAAATTINPLMSTATQPTLCRKRYKSHYTAPHSIQNYYSSTARSNHTRPANKIIYHNAKQIVPQSSISKSIQTTDSVRKVKAENVNHEPEILLNPSERCMSTIDAWTCTSETLMRVCSGRSMKHITAPFCQDNTTRSLVKSVLYPSVWNMTTRDNLSDESADMLQTLISRPRSKSVGTNTCDFEEIENDKNHRQISKSDDVLNKKRSDQTELISHDKREYLSKMVQTEDHAALRDSKKRHSSTVKSLKRKMTKTVSDPPSKIRQFCSYDKNGVRSDRSFLSILTNKENYNVGGQDFDSDQEVNSFDSTSSFHSNNDDDCASSTIKLQCNRIVVCCNENSKTGGLKIECSKFNNNKSERRNLNNYKKNNVKVETKNIDSKSERRRSYNHRDNSKDVYKSSNETKLESCQNFNRHKQHSNDRHTQRTSNNRNNALKAKNMELSKISSNDQSAYDPRNRQRPAICCSCDNHRVGNRSNNLKAADSIQYDRHDKFDIKETKVRYPHIREHRTSIKFNRGFDGPSDICSKCNCETDTDESEYYDNGNSLSHQNNDCDIQCKYPSEWKMRCDSFKNDGAVRVKCCSFTSSPSTKNSNSSVLITQQEYEKSQKLHFSNIEKISLPPGSGPSTNYEKQTPRERRHYEACLKTRSARTMENRENRFRNESNSRARVLDSNTSLSLFGSDRKSKPTSMNTNKRDINFQSDSISSGFEDRKISDRRVFTHFQNYENDSDSCNDMTCRVKKMSTQGPCQQANYRNNRDEERPTPKSTLRIKNNVYNDNSQRQQGFSKHYNETDVLCCCASAQSLQNNFKNNSSPDYCDDMTCPNRYVNSRNNNRNLNRSTPKPTKRIKNEVYNDKPQTQQAFNKNYNETDVLCCCASAQSLQNNFKNNPSPYYCDDMTCPNREANSRNYRDVDRLTPKSNQRIKKKVYNDKSQRQQAFSKNYNETDVLCCCASAQSLQNNSSPDYCDDITCPSREVNSRNNNRNLDRSTPKSTQRSKNEVYNDKSQRQLPNSENYNKTKVSYCCADGKDDFVDGRNQPAHKRFEWSSCNAAKPSFEKKSLNTNNSHRQTIQNNNYMNPQEGISNRHHAQYRQHDNDYRKSIPTQGNDTKPVVTCNNNNCPQRNNQQRSSRPQPPPRRKSNTKVLRKSDSRRRPSQQRAQSHYVNKGPCNEANCPSFNKTNEMISNYNHHSKDASTYQKSPSTQPTQSPTSKCACQSLPSTQPSHYPTDAKTFQKQPYTSCDLQSCPVSMKQTSTKHNSPARKNNSKSNKDDVKVIHDSSSKFSEPPKSFSCQSVRETIYKTFGYENSDYKNENGPKRTTNEEKSEKRKKHKTNKKPSGNEFFTMCSNNTKKDTKNKRDPCVCN